MQSTFEAKIERLRKELNALTETIIAAHMSAHDEADLDKEISNVIEWRKGILSGEIVR